MMTEKEMAPDCLAAPGAVESTAFDDLGGNYTLYEDIEKALPPICDVETVAAFMNMKPSSIRTLCRTGELRAIKAGALWRIPRAWIMEYIYQGGC